MYGIVYIATNIFWLKTPESIITNGSTVTNAEEKCTKNATHESICTACGLIEMVLQMTLNWLFFAKKGHGSKPN